MDSTYTSKLTSKIVSSLKSWFLLIQTLIYRVLRPGTVWTWQKPGWKPNKKRRKSPGTNCVQKCRTGWEYPRLTSTKWQKIGKKYYQVEVSSKKHKEIKFETGRKNNYRNRWSSCMNIKLRLRSSSGTRRWGESLKIKGYKDWLSRESSTITKNNSKNRQWAAEQGTCLMTEMPTSAGRGVDRRCRKPNSWLPNSAGRVLRSLWVRVRRMCWF